MLRRQLKGGLHTEVEADLSVKLLSEMHERLKAERSKLEERL